MKTIVSNQKGAVHQQDMKLYAFPIPVGEDACRRAP
jgi:hypothetical protein